MTSKIIQSYFHNLTQKQIEQFDALFELYQSWNAQINVTLPASVNGLGQTDGLDLWIQDLNGQGQDFLDNTFRQLQTQSKSYSSFENFDKQSTNSKANLNIKIDGEYAEANMFGLYIPNGKQHVDNHTAVDHAKPNSNSNELYKGILKDKSTGVFNGKIYVRQDAQKTNAFQSCKNVLISNDATMNTKP
mgnify:CR=1 FL=1